MPNLRYELHHKICQFTLWNSRLWDEFLINEVTTNCSHFHLIFYCRLYFTAFTIVSMQLIVNAKMMIERNTLLKCIKTCGITSASVPNNCSIPSKNPLFIILSFSSQMLVNAPSIILVIMVTSITLLPDYLTSQSAPCYNTHKYAYTIYISIRIE